MKIFRKVIDGPTPSGGVKLEILFYDKDWKAVEEKESVNLVLNEYDDTGKLLRSTYGKRKQKKE